MGIRPQDTWQSQWDWSRSTGCCCPSPYSRPLGAIVRWHWLRDGIALEYSGLDSALAFRARDTSRALRCPWSTAIGQVSPSVFIELLCLSQRLGHFTFSSVPRAAFLLPAPGFAKGDLAGPGENQSQSERKTNGGKHPTFHTHFCCIFV